MNKPVILVADDLKTNRTLIKAFLPPGEYSLLEAADGTEALEIVKNGRPDLILLDWNLPKKNGSEVLSEIKTDEELKTIPVIILTTSKAHQDIYKAYGLHANCYITKPVDLNQFLSAVNTIEDFWFTIVKLPPEKNAQ